MSPSRWLIKLLIGFYRGNTEAQGLAGWQKLGVMTSTAEAGYSGETAVGWLTLWDCYWGESVTVSNKF